MNTSISITFSAEKLSGLIYKSVQEALHTYHNQFTKNSPESYRTKAEVAKQYRISLPTVTHYTKKGIIKGEKIGSRWRYKASDIEAGWKTFKKYTANWIAQLQQNNLSIDSGIQKNY